MKISCIIPTFNEGKRVIQVIKELIKSKYLAEIICVDDHYTDQTAAINNYMLVNQRTCFWSPSSAQNTFKIEKYGLFIGLIKDLQMHWSIFIKNTGFFNYHYLKQIFTFCKKQI
jgi:hypothetical protein